MTIFLIPTLLNSLRKVGKMAVFCYFDMMSVFNFFDSFFRQVLKNGFIRLKVHKKWHIFHYSLDQNSFKKLYSYSSESRENGIFFVLAVIPTTNRHSKLSVAIFDQFEICRASVEEYFCEKIKKIHATLKVLWPYWYRLFSLKNVYRSKKPRFRPLRHFSDLCGQKKKCSSWKMGHV